MNAITKFDKDTLRVLHAQAISVLNKELADLGVRVVYAGGTCGATKATLKFELQLVGEHAEAQRKDEEKDLWCLYCRHFGLRDEHFGQSFINRSTRYTITGINPSAHTFPIKVVRADGKSFKFPADAVVDLLQRPASIMLNRMDKVTVGHAVEQQA